MRHRKHRHRGTGSERWGHSDMLRNPPALLLYNFDVGKWQLKAEHREELDRLIVPKIKFKHGVTVVGLASPTGGPDRNMFISFMRAEATISYLCTKWREFKRIPAVAFGKEKALKEGVPDHTENERFRSVVIYVGQREEPPFPPGVIDVTPELPESFLPEGGFHLSASETNDTFNMIGQFLEQVPWTKVAEFGEQLDLVTVLIQGIAGMPMLWSELKELNETNGRLEAWWEGLQDMADQYKRADLSTTPMKNWPALKPPKPRPMPRLSGGGINIKEWMDGKREMCEALFKIMEHMERQPEIKNNWAITGRRWLFMLSQKFGSGVEAAAQGYVVEQLRGRGKDWPLK